MDLSFIQPRQELRPYIKSFWVCESAVGLPETDRSLAAPNGCPKLIVPCENSLESLANGRLQVSHEQGLYFVGNRDSSTLIRSSSRRTVFIGIEFAPHGAFCVRRRPRSAHVYSMSFSGCRRWQAVASPRPAGRWKSRTGQTVFEEKGKSVSSWRTSSAPIACGWRRRASAG